MKFSQRIAKTPVRQSLQIETIDDDLRTALWNMIVMVFLEKLNYRLSVCTPDERLLFKFMWHDFFKLPVDTLPDNTTNIKDHIRDWYFRVQWFEIYDLLEWICRFDDTQTKRGASHVFNGAMEQEMSAYRIIDNIVVQITDEAELREIETSIDIAKKTKLSGVQEHLRSALDKLSDRKSPDFRNSIKESISAVESIAKIISGNPKADLAAALKVVEDKVGLHPALKKGFTSLYAYTSDEGGIRHALIESSESEFEDANTCSSYVRHLSIICR